MIVVFSCREDVSFVVAFGNCFGTGVVFGKTAWVTCGSAVLTVRADVVFSDRVVVTGGAAVVSEEADVVVCKVLSGKLGTQHVLK